MELIYAAEAAVVTVLLGLAAIPLARKYKARQSIREEGPKSHRIKAGTPTMGGLFMLLAALLVIGGNHLYDPAVLLLVLITFGHALLGFLDDFIKAEKKRNLGLTARQKLLGQLILSIVFCFGCVEYLGLPTSISIPFIDTDIFHWGFLLSFCGSGSGRRFQCRQSDRWSGWSGCRMLHYCFRGLCTILLLVGNAESDSLCSDHCRLLCRFSGL